MDIAKQLLNGLILNIHPKRRELIAIHCKLLFIITNYQAVFRSFSYQVEQLLRVQFNSTSH